MGKSLYQHLTTHLDIQSCIIIYIGNATSKGPPKSILLVLKLTDDYNKNAG